MPSLSNFHLPLPPDLHEMLRDEAEHSGKPATAIAREALQSWLTQRRKQRLHAEIAAWAAEQAGTDLDLDKDLEEAGLDVVGGIHSPVGEELSVAEPSSPQAVTVTFECAIAMGGVLPR